MLLLVCIAYVRLSIKKFLKKSKKMVVSMPSIFRGGAFIMQCLGIMKLQEIWSEVSSRA